MKKTNTLNAAAVALGKRRWQLMTDEQRTDHQRAAARARWDRVKAARKDPTKPRRKGA